MRHDPQQEINEKLNSWVKENNLREEDYAVDLYERFYDGDYDEEDMENFDSLIEYYNNRD